MGRALAILLWTMSVGFLFSRMERMRTKIYVVGQGEGVEGK